VGKKVIDLTGQTFGWYVVLGRVGSDKWGCPTWSSRCACGATRTVSSGKLKSGETSSCGCRRVAVSRAKATTHGETTHGTMSPEYRVWQLIIDRCENPHNKSYADYGGRGIAITAEWRHDFPAFLASVGRRPSAGHSIDRIDNAKGYEPGNVRWATRREQNSNKRSNVLLTIDGVTKLVVHWADENGLKRGTVALRIKNGWAHKLAVTTPPDCRNRRAA
jgi:hypothetical protein